MSDHRRAFLDSCLLAALVIGRDLAAAARAEYERRLAKCEALERAGKFNHEIAARLHNWQRIAWLFDARRRATGEQLLIWPEDLPAMAAEAEHCAKIARASAEADADDSASARELWASNLYLIARSLQCRFENRKREREKTA